MPARATFYGGSSFWVTGRGRADGKLQAEPGLGRARFQPVRAPAAQDVLHRLVSRDRRIRRPGTVGVPNGIATSTGRVDLRVVDGDLIVDGVLVGARKALDRVQTLALRNSPDAPRGGVGRNPSLAVVVGDVHNQRVAFPVTDRVAVPEAHRLGQVLAVVGRDDTRRVNHLVMNDHIPWRLDDLIGVVVTRRKERTGNAAGDAAIPRAHELIAVRVARVIVVAPRFGRGFHGHAPIGGLDHE